MVPWWFWPNSAMINAGCPSPIHRLGTNSTSVAIVSVIIDWEKPKFQPKMSHTLKWRFRLIFGYLLYPVDRTDSSAFLKQSERKQNLSVKSKNVIASRFDQWGHGCGLRRSAAATEQPSTHPATQNSRQKLAAGKEIGKIGHLFSLQRRCQLQM